MRADDNKVTWTAALTEDVFRYIGAYPIYFRTVAVIEEGQIQSMTWIMHKESIAQLEAAGHKTIARRVLEEAWNQGNLDTVDELFAAETVYHDPDHGDITGRAAVKELINEFRTAFPDLQFTIEQQMVEGEVVATRWQATGTHQGEYRGVAPTGKSITLSGVTLFQVTAVSRVEERQIVESWSYWNGLGLLVQLGVATDGSQ
ncbi:MAG: ester cyclase [Caldilineaceae bacterium]